MQNLELSSSFSRFEVLCKLFAVPVPVSPPYTTTILGFEFSICSEIVVEPVGRQ